MSLVREARVAQFHMHHRNIPQAMWYVSQWVVSNSWHSSSVERFD